jgi:hypothetical protein
MTRTETGSENVSTLSTDSIRKRRLALVASALAVIGLAVALRYLAGIGSAEAQIPNPFRSKEPAQQQASQPKAVTGAPQQASAQLPRHERPKHDVMAVVNGQDIRRGALASACVDRYGEEVLEGLVNKRLILHHCKNRGIEVTDQEIDADDSRSHASSCSTIYCASEA